MNEEQAKNDIETFKYLSEVYVAALSKPKNNSYLI